MGTKVNNNNTRCSIRQCNINLSLSFKLVSKVIAGKNHRVSPLIIWNSTIENIKRQACYTNISTHPISNNQFTKPGNTSIVFINNTSHKVIKQSKRDENIQLAKYITIPIYYLHHLSTKQLWENNRKTFLTDSLTPQHRPKRCQRI